MSKTTKIILSIITLALIVISVPVGVYLVDQRQEIRKRAAPATTLSLSPATGLRVSSEEEFSLTVEIDTGENFVTATDVTLTFDPSLIEAQGVTPGTFLGSVDKAGEVLPGRVWFIYHNDPPQQSSGPGNLATVSFKVLADANPGPSPITTTIEFSPQTEIGAMDEGEVKNVLVGTTPATVTILAGEVLPTNSPTPDPNPTNSPTPDPDPTNSPTPTPTTAPAGGGTATPTSTTAPAQMPVSGDSIPSLLLTLGGGALLVLGLFALLLL